MPEITAAMVKELRDSTNVSMMECKRALAEAGGDMAQATRLLRERGMAVAAKKSSRAANQGLVVSAASPDGAARSLIEVNCETDFVARNDGFKAFVRDLAERACAGDELLAETAREEVTAKIAEIGENIVIRRHTRFVPRGLGAVASYIHMGGKVGVLIEVGCQKAGTVQDETFRAMVTDLTLHIAACAPRHLASGDVPANEIATEREIYAKQVEGKPAQVLEKIVDGKLKKYFADVCLIEQPFVKEPKKSVATLLAETGRAVGDTLVIRRFARYQIGA